ncbi:MAG: DUF2169 domain-containing protein [Myxococcales bacterium]|nr:DUF2169 domain-containing protein [Myxococcales bacterium]
MKVLKPSKLSVLNRCFEHRRRYYMGVSVLAFIPLEDAPVLLPEAAMWVFAGERLGAEALDVGIPKARGEFLVDGKAFAPGGAPAAGVPVRAAVGPIDKQLYVQGDRYWSGLGATEPMAFTEMPLGWAQAYGGEGYTRNPLGKGFAEIEVEGTKLRPLPNLEDPRQLVSSPRDRPEPAGFGPIDISWPQRTALAGTHDQHWLENLFPGFAADVDWGLHNLAPRDQQREGFWQGGEPFRFDNLHPSKAVVGELPRFRARVFISRSHRIGEPRPPAAEIKAGYKAPPKALEEIPLALQTLWFFPDAELGVLIWQGSTLVAEEDGADILHLVAAAEHADRPRSIERYLEVATSRFDKDFAPIAALREWELLPEDLGPAPGPADEDAVLNKIENLAGQNMHRRMAAEAEKGRAYVASFGLDPDIHGPAKVGPPTPPPSPQEIPALLEELKRKEIAERAEMEAKQKAAQAEIDKMVDEAGIDGFNSEVLHEEQKQTQIGPPTWTAAALHAMLEKEAIATRSHGFIVEELEEMLVDEKLHAHWDEVERQMFASYRLQAHRQTPAPAMAMELREPTRARVQAAVAGGEDFAKLNMTGADLSGMSLVGADLRGAFFESANLDGADLSNAILSGATLAHASLRGTKLDGAKLDGVNLGKARLTETSLRGCNLEKAVLEEAVLERAVLDGCNCEGISLLRAKFDGVSAREIVGVRLLFLEVELAAVDFGGARMFQATFIANDLRGSRFAGANLASTTFLNSKLDGVDFSGADLTNVRCVEGTTMAGAVFTGATLVSANLRGMPLAGADFRKATLDKADLCECDLAGAKFYQAVARGTKFEVADLRGAELMSANFMHASFARATIYGADLRGANLHGTDMARVRSDSAVQLDGALLTKVRIHPRHVEQTPEGS